MIKVENITKTFGSKTILDGVSFVISKNEKVGIVGPNGTGKTTLLKIILRDEEGDSGFVDVGKEKLGYLPQKVTFESGQTVQGYLVGGLDKAWEGYKIDRTLVLAGLEPSIRNSLMEKISGGQKTRVAIARLLLSDPTILLLDEPTNNLDLLGIGWFENFVKNFDGTVLVISHDRTFLDNTVCKILELDPFTHKVEEYSGGYSDFVVQRHARMQKQLEDYERYQTKKAKMEEWIALKRQQLAIYINPKVGSQLQAMKHRYEREIVENEVEKPRDYKNIKLAKLANESHPSKVIFHVENAIYPNIVSCKELTIFGTDRVHLQGINGSGKTTLIKMLLGLVKNFSGVVKKGEKVKIGYFAQEHEVLDNLQTVIKDFINKTNITNEDQARKILGKFLFTENRVFQKIESLSQGEKVKLVIAILTNQDNNFLILDEPTNHLDLESREVLEYSLNEYGGGFMVVSHDRYFIKQIGINRELDIRSGELVEKFG